MTGALEHQLVVRAHATADRILGCLGIEMAKRLDLATAAGFDHAVASLASELRHHAAQPEADAVRAALRVLDVDWMRTTAVQRRQLVSSALVAAARKTALIPAQIRAPLDDAARQVFAVTRSHARRDQGLAIAADFNAVDHRAIAHVMRSEGNFVRDQYGRRLAGFGQRARQVVADGIEAGLGRADIAAQLADAARAALVERAPFYWEVVAGSFIGRGRSFAQTSAYAEAGIERYQIQSVLDSRTSAICRFMNGRVFSVRRALDHFETVDALGDPEDIKRVTPWVRESRGQLYVQHASGRILLADIVRNAVGTADDVGEFHAHVDDNRLAEVGALFPPLHALCRSTSLPL